MVKLLITDLDGTLWQGVAAEGKVRIKQGVVRRMRELQSKGVLVAVCSKNNEKDVVSQLKKIKLKFSKVVVNWRNKLYQVEEVLSQFNFEDRAVVFVDDDEFNRELVKHNHPEMAVLSPEVFNNFALSTLHDPLTEEDLERTLYTEAEEGRKEERKKFKTEEEFLTSLNMTLTIYKNYEPHRRRANQLLERTTQFNFSQLRTLSKDFYTAKLEDKFGSMGIIGVLILEEEELVKQFVLSCRVLGRGVESAFYKEVVKGLKAYLLPMFEIVLTTRNKEVVPTALLNISRETPWIEVVKKF